jgi:hypothetical protein
MSCSSDRRLANIGDAASPPSHPKRVFSLVCYGAQVGPTVRLFGVSVLHNLCD